MITIIFGSIWGVICFVLGCVLTFLVCKHYEGLAIEAKVQKLSTPPPRVIRSSALLDPVMPKTINRNNIEYDDDEGDDDEDN